MSDLSVEIKETAFPSTLEASGFANFAAPRLIKMPDITTMERPTSIIPLQVASIEIPRGNPIRTIAFHQRRFGNGPQALRQKCSIVDRWRDGSLGRIRCRISSAGV